MLCNDLNVCFAEDKKIFRIDAEPVRSEADELTYSLHILVRYELEKAFVNGDISVDEIPAMFNAKMKEYFGLDVLSDDTGCLASPNNYMRLR